jgi:hypothetical protein
VLVEAGGREMGYLNELNVEMLVPELRKVTGSMTWE